MSNADFKELLDKYLNDSLSVDELHELLGQLSKYENTEALQAAIQQALDDNTFKDLSDKSRTDLIFNRIMQQARDEEALGGEVIPMSSARGFRQQADAADIAAGGRTQRSSGRWRWAAVAAAALIAITSGIYLIKLPHPQSAISVSRLPPASNDVAPGRNKAILQLADSSSIVLDDSDTGMLAQQGSTKILKLTGGQLTYKTPAGYKQQAANQPLYNIISTPRGGQYQVILPDGSKVWLNAASTLRFPTAFTGKERSVMLTGEAYFDIAPNKNMPFTVQAGDTKVEVLGTHFNIMAYENEDMINTTLLEGSIRVSGRKGEGIRLRPGQQATMSNGSGMITAHEADTESVIAWKNGAFQFDGNDVQTLMRQIERWYDVDVQYAGKAPEGHYSGTIGRDKSLLKVLRIFEEEGDIKFKIEGKNLTVL
jgi:hypothetical protein